MLLSKLSTKFRTTYFQHFTKRETINFFRLLLGWYVLITGALVASQYLYYYVTPINTWVEYHKVEPYTSEISINEDLVFVSYATGQGGFPVSWSDVLKCDFNDDLGFTFYSVYNSNTDTFLPSNSGKPWVYQADVPTVPATCFLEANVTLHLPFGITKEQHILTDTFEVK